MVSVLASGVLTRVVAAHGTERDGTFVPAGWETLGHGGAAYALTTYRDRSGRLAATAWLRHDAATGPQTAWSGMLSLPMHLSARAGGGLHVAPHPDVDTLRTGPLAAAGGTVDLAGEDGVAELDVTLPAGAQLRLETADQPVLLTAAGDGLAVQWAAGTASLPGSAAGLRVVLDRGALEAWTRDGRWIALRIPYLHVRRAWLAGAGELAAWRLEPVQEHRPER